MQKQKYAFYGIFSVYVVFLPGVYLFAYYYNMKFNGVWLALNLGLMTVSIVYFLKIFNTDWDEVI